MTEDWYDDAQVCLYGHTINSQVVHRPEHNREFCDKCGQSTITRCQGCDTPIRGYYHKGIVGTSSPTADYSPPSFCHNCGKPYPWTEARLKAAQELSDELDGLTDQEKATLKRSLDDMVRDTPQATVAAIRFKKLVAKAGQEAAGAFRQILVDVVSETIRKSIWG